MEDTPTPRRARLRTLDDLKRYTANLIHETREGKVEPGLSSKIGYLIGLLTGLIRDSDVEARVAEIERTLKEDRNG